jgi:hypothetical protein
MNTNSYLRLLLMVLADALAKLRSRIQSDPTLHRILVVFVTGLVLRDAVLGIFDWCSRVRGQCWSGCLFFSHIHYLVSIYIL